MKTVDFKLCVKAIRATEFPETVDNGRLQEISKRIGDLAISRAALAIGHGVIWEKSFLQCALEAADK